MVKNTTTFQVLGVSCKLLYNLQLDSLITTPSTDATNSLQYKGIFLSNVT